jgi:phosphoribosylaminoimidazolecarboxamide formyltransferase/IMP cyclohydrolase
MDHAATAASVWGMTRFTDGLECAYGENAWQAPARFVPDADGSRSEDPLALQRFELVEGSAPSYNNLAEIDRQLQTVTHIAAALDVNGIGVGAIACGTKHGNACGAGIAPAGDPGGALRRMVTGDTRAIFGGVVMTSFPIDGATAEILSSHASAGPRLLDVVLAPSFSADATELLARKRGKCRLIANPALASLTRASLETVPRRRHVRGGYLEQPNFTFVLDLADAEIDAPDGSPLPPALRQDLLLAWAVGSTSNSNTVTLVRDGQRIGNGVGQQDRVGGCELAIRRATGAGHETAGAVAYSDSFFPFPDGPEVLIDAGVRAVLCTTGSVRDDEVRATFLDAGVTLVQLPDRAARGFFGH